jgi:hypothetical protein
MLYHHCSSIVLEYAVKKVQGNQVGLILNVGFPCFIQKLGHSEIHTLKTWCIKKTGQYKN